MATSQPSFACYAAQDVTAHQQLLWAVQAERGEGWSQGIRFILGGTGVHNSRTFLADLMLMAESDRNTGESYV